METTIQPKNTFTKLFAFADGYMKLHTKFSTMKGKYTFTRKQRNLNHIKEDVRKVPISLSFTLNNLITDQKIGKII